MKKCFFLTILLLAVTASFFGLEAASVRVAGDEGNWILEADGKPFYVRGAGCGLAVGSGGEDYLKLAVELGANCVRTWGTDQGTAEYLDSAAKHGLLVDAGIWINYSDPACGISYIGDTEYKRNKRKEVLDYVRRFRKHPAIAFWNVGNEALFFTSSEDEKVALCRFLESVTQEIHKIDPDHPVIYTSSGYMELPYIKKYIPSLDIVGMNVYGSIRAAHGNWEYTGIHKPYIITEYGPSLAQDSAKDQNGKAVELGDSQKAILYKKCVFDIESFKGYNLGGFVFHLGDTTQESLTWWNINHGMLKKPSFWAIRAAYTGKTYPDKLPKILKFTLSKCSDVAPGEVITLESKVDYSYPEQLEYSYALSTTQQNIYQYYVNQQITPDISGKGPKVTLKAPYEEGIYRVYVLVKDSKGNVTTASRTVRVGK